MSRLMPLKRRTRNYRGLIGKLRASRLGDERFRQRAKGKVNVGTEQRLDVSASLKRRGRCSTFSPGARRRFLNEGHAAGHEKGLVSRCALTRNSGAYDERSSNCHSCFCSVVV